MHRGFGDTTTPVTAIPSALGHGREPIPVASQAMFQEAEPMVMFKKRGRSANDAQSKNENNKCLHSFSMGPQTSQFKNGVVRC